MQENPSNVLPSVVPAAIPNPVPNAYMPSIPNIAAPPPPPIDSRPPPPPPPQATDNTQQYAAAPPSSQPIQNSVLNQTVNEQSNTVKKSNDTLAGIQTAQNQSSNAAVYSTNYPQQNYQQQSYPQQNYPQQNFPPQNYSQQNYPQQNYSQQNYQQPTYPQQTHSQQTYQQPNQTQQNHPPPNHPPPNQSHQNHPQRNQPQLNQSQMNHPPPSNSHQNHSQRNQSQPNHSKQNYPQQTNSAHAEHSQSQQNQDGFRRNNRANRWGNDNSNNANNNNNNNRNSRSFGGNSFNNLNTFDRDEPEKKELKRDLPDADELNDNADKSQDEIAFEAQFRKWEDSFMEWKRNNANHPDRNQYNEFVEKMEGCRRQLQQRREMLRKKHLDSKRDAQLPDSKQSEQQSKPNKENDKIESTRAAEPSTKLPNESHPIPPSANLFTNRSDSEAGIPGLDLVAEESAPTPKSDPNIVARVTNILGNPEIQSLLSNIQIQKQQHETAQSNPVDIQHTNQSDAPRIGSNAFNRSDDVDHFDHFGHSDHFDQFDNDNPDMEMSPPNPFRKNKRGGYDQPPADNFEKNAKRGRFWNDNAPNKNSNFFDQMNRDGGNFPQQVIQSKFLFNFY